MANIFINDNLRLSRLGLQVKDSESQWTDLHCQQGRLDGACVVYSVVMSLLSIGYISNNDIDVSKNPNPDKRKGKGRLLSRLLDENGLVRDGYYLRTMTKLLRESCPDLKIGYHTKEDYFLSIIKDSVENDTPVVICVNNNDMNHGITVVGIEYDNNEKAYPTANLGESLRWFLACYHLEERKDNSPAVERINGQNVQDCQQKRQ